MAIADYIGHSLAAFQYAQQQQPEAQVHPENTLAEGEIMSSTQVATRNKTTGGFAIIASIITLGLAVSLVLLQRIVNNRKKKRKEEEEQARVGDDSVGKGGKKKTRGNLDDGTGFTIPVSDGDGASLDAAAEAALKVAFEKEAKNVWTLPEGVVTQGDRLMLYGLYKQANLGDRKDAGGPEPSRFNVVAHAKYAAWGKFDGMSKSAAMINYIEAVRHFSEQSAKGEVADPNADIVYEDDDGEVSTDDEADDDANDGVDVGGGMSGMGLKPSTLMNASDLTEEESGGEEKDDDDTTVSPNERMRKAARADNPSKLKDCITKGKGVVDVNDADEHGETALHFAADQGSTGCVSILLNAGANPNACDKHGISVLQAAVIGGDVETVRLLLKAGANPDHEDDDGDTPRSCAEDDGDEEMKALFGIGEEDKTDDETEETEESRDD